jgi:hypothetical protein
MFTTFRDAHIAHTFLATTPTHRGFPRPGDNGRCAISCRETFRATVLMQSGRHGLPRPPINEVAVIVPVMTAPIQVAAFALFARGDQHMATRDAGFEGGDSRDGDEHRWDCAVAIARFSTL